ncbi:hypothetical protein BWI97_22130 [Siphonobacter sp. BAB-5405]|nr:hypothetical protein BWI97_22130 [Siphonobacter sp. BAB-5405]
MVAAMEWDRTGLGCMSSMKAIASKEATAKRWNSFPLVSNGTTYGSSNAVECSRLSLVVERLTGY